MVDTSLKSSFLKSIIDEYLGVSEFIKPIVQKITVKFVAREESAKEFDFDELFIRLPPFEPITMVESVYGSKGIRFVGDYVWFITSIKDAYDILTKLEGMFSDIEKKYGVKCKEIICGEYVPYADGFLLKRLVVPRVIGDGSQKWFKDIMIPVKWIQGTIGQLKIIYGFTKETIEKWKQRVKVNVDWDKPEKVLSIHEIASIFIGKEKRRGYVPTILNYITKCFDGWIITTDPFVIGKPCPECDERGAGKLLRCRRYPGRGLYDYRRKIFPRVYAEIENIIMEKDVNRMQPLYRVPFICIIADNVKSMKRVKAFSTYFDIGRVRIELTKPIVSQHFDTNGFVTLIDRQFVDTFIEVVKKSSSNVGCNIYVCRSDKGVDRIKLPLINILVAKFIWKNLFLGERNYDIDIDIDNVNNALNIKIKVVEAPGKENQYSLLDPNDVSKLVKDISSMKEFQDYVTSVLAHTLAHAMLLGLSNLVPEVEDYGAYVSQVGDTYVLSAVIENTRGGALEMFTQVRQTLQKYVLNNVNDMYILKPSALEEVLGGVIELINNVDEIVKKVVEESCREVNEGLIIQNAVKSIVQSIDIKEGDEVAELLKDENFVKLVVTEFISLFKNTADLVLRSGFYIDRESFTSIILWRILLIENIEEKILNHVKTRILNALKKGNVRLRYGDEELFDAIRLIFDKLIEVEMTRIVTKILLPDYCSDGCDQDLHLTNCSVSTLQPYMISRCLLMAFLRFSGLNINHPRLELIRFDCTGAELKTLAQLAKERLYILTSGFEEDSIRILSEILSSNSNVKVQLELDQRIREVQQKLIDMLKQLRKMYGNRFEFVLTSEPHHGKMLMVDSLKIHTSWNFGVGMKVLQTCHSELVK